ncbi:bifunctional hydroxymethylpyrimidine kinase/phosphomethylpyrimidine kinase [Paenibacillus sambharensis]|uniref:Hydroxymethylpyrimidine/phosphomethylpyrimidine kinase n=2 Tax=Paenibacillus sambharensis TaxID=1803190 RepID=A0A2W1LKY9_9BACL|nr:bifunctional hydroxymethylpyrimidine kinase/phosphomethylpyrimidine kinase [Paenibacillus sambharensis]
MQQSQQREYPLALTIAGSDSGGGAGIQADLKTMQELGVFGTSALTAVTAQNSMGVHGVYPLSVETVAAQMDAVLSDMGADSVKTGMLFAPDIIRVVSAKLGQYGRIPVIVDPVMIAKGGAPLLQEEAVETMKVHLFPLSEVVTPNIPEACALLGLQEDDIRSEADMAEAGRALLRYGCGAVLIKGGHLPAGSAGGECVDVLVTGGAEPSMFRTPRLPTRHTHGTGCTLSSAIAAMRARGENLPDAVRAAKHFVTAAIAASVPTGQGIGSLWHAAHREVPAGR